MTVNLPIKLENLLTSLPLDGAEANKNVQVAHARLLYGMSSGKITLI